jgi:hypothetical protein
MISTARPSPWTATDRSGLISNSRYVRARVWRSEKQVQSVQYCPRTGSGAGSRRGFTLRAIKPGDRRTSRVVGAGTPCPLKRCIFSACFCPRFRVTIQPKYRANEKSCLIDATSAQPNLSLVWQPKTRRSVNQDLFAETGIFFANNSCIGLVKNRLGAGRDQGIIGLRIPCQASVITAALTSVGHRVPWPSLVTGRVN